MSQYLGLLALLAPFTQAFVLPAPSCQALRGSSAVSLVDPSWWSSPPSSVVSKLTLYRGDSLADSSTDVNSPYAPTHSTQNGFSSSPYGGAATGTLAYRGGANNYHNIGGGTPNGRAHRGNSNNMINGRGYNYNNDYYYGGGTGAYISYNGPYQNSYNGPSRNDLRNNGNYMNNGSYNGNYMNSGNYMNNGSYNGYYNSNNMNNGMSRYGTNGGYYAGTNGYYGGAFHHNGGAGTYNGPYRNNYLDGNRSANYGGVPSGYAGSSSTYGYNQGINRSGSYNSNSNSNSINNNYAFGNQAGYYNNNYNNVGNYQQGYHNNYNNGGNHQQGYYNGIQGGRYYSQGHYNQGHYSNNVRGYHQGGYGGTSYQLRDGLRTSNSNVNNHNTRGYHGGSGSVY